MTEVNPTRDAPSRFDAYGSLVLDHVPRLLSGLDRERDSISYGSLDREHWAWNFRDFPIVTLHTAIVPLSLLWTVPLPDNPYYRNERVLAWLEGAVVHLCRRQHRNGAFDSVAPFTQDHGVSLAFAYMLHEVLKQVGDAWSPTEQERIRGAIGRAGAFALRTDEDYAFITNHQALFALGYEAAYAVTDNQAFRDRVELIVDQILAQQGEHGSYAEYGGFDPGYESLSLTYLAKLYHSLPSEALLGSLRRSVERFSYSVHPDGSVGGNYGSRHTSLYFPAGFEALDDQIPLAGAVARFMRTRLTRNQVVTPATADPENLPIIMMSYLQSCRLSAAGVAVDGPALPCEVLQGTRDCSDGLFVHGDTRYYAVFNFRKGGVGRVFDKRTETVVYEDAGYLVAVGRRRWSSQILTPTAECELGGDEVIGRCRLAEVEQLLPTPWSFVVLRLLNLTVFRSLRLGRIIRRLIVGRLTTRRRSGPFTLARTIRFRDGALEIQDRLQRTGGAQIDELSIARAFTGIRMGSAKYFHGSDLVTTPLPTVDAMRRSANETGVGDTRFVVRFLQNGATELVNMPCPPQATDGAASRT